ncbi:uncharacterized protein EI97DRAFT_441487 [Westerdykella ornata]|uniref:Cellular morphogenesis protein n=1 Tax=Westerdykella ornata TaxID=318751 RepID=A0A6A6JMI6_WESOR|nr:uncharacterized protein EI97DRAFT_441487 [Westerdykella ornata]KAF2277435.1 hypothetical protein EI97DRAFT_441487 [Westerdykella ornata]
MREPFASLMGSRPGQLPLGLFLALPGLISGISAFAFTPIPSPNLDLARLGRVAFAGDFDSISLYQYEGQNKQPTGNNGALLSRYPNGVFAPIKDTDADVKAMCPYWRNGDYRGVIFGGNFTSVGGLHTPGGIALLNTNDGAVTPLEGLNGSVNALYCDRDVNNGRVYVGGSFTGGNSTNAIIWEDQWVDLSFSGFNGPIHSIVKAPNTNIIFGGEFNGLGGNATAPKKNDSQVLPIGSASLTAQTSSGRPGLTDPQSIVCKDDPNTEGPGATWLLADNSPGFWRADFGFGFTPTLLRLHNTKFEGRGTKTWRFTALPDGGIMNFSYVDPEGQKRFCDARCPLPQGDTSAKDFQFVNNVGMNSFRIDISNWYGAGGGLNGIQLFQDDIYTFAINNFNEPRCGGSNTGASSTPTGPWANTPSHNSNSQYLTAVLQGDNINPNDASVVFSPDIKQSGNYTLKVYTPGCVGDGTCSTRGRVNITRSLNRASQDLPTSTELFQTNEFDKYDEIYSGYIDATDGFRPTVTLRPSAGQRGPLTIVAQRIRFELKNATAGGLNGIFEFDPTKREIDTDFGASVINSAGAGLRPNEQAIVSSLAAEGNRLYVGGNFSAEGISNVFVIEKDATELTPLAGGGLNGQVLTIFTNGSNVYVGGNFTNTRDNGARGLNGVALYSNNQWQPLGAGVNGIVMYIVPFALNMTGSTPEPVLGVSGFFDRVNGFDNNAAFEAKNFAVWVPSRRNWLHNLNLRTISIQGKMTAFTNVPAADPVYAGSVSSYDIGASGAVALRDGKPLTLSSFPAVIREQQQQGSLRKRALAEGQDLTTTGVMTATFYKENNMNKTILAGHFASTGTGGENITNLLIIDGKDSDRVTGLGEGVDANSTFAALAVLDNILYAGGAVTGRINNNRAAGLIAYDLAANRLAATQPPALQGENVTVNVILAKPKSKDVFVGGKFQSAGALSCEALCVWNTERSQWISPGGDLSGVVSSLIWVSDTKLLIAGNITSGNNATTKIISYDSSNNKFEEFVGARDLPGPVTALSPANRDASQVWASGRNSDGSAYLQRYNGEKWLPVNGMFQPGTNVRSIQVLQLSEDGQHGQSDLIDRRQDLLILGQINVTDFGSASGVLFNGTTMIPFLLSTTSDNKPGSLSQVFVENPQSFFESSGKRLALGFIVLIALAIALALTFLLVVAGILLEWYRKRAKGYSPAPTVYPTRHVDMARVPPEHLFGTLQSANRAPAI